MLVVLFDLKGSDSMYKQLLALSTNSDFGISTKEQIKRFKQAGFEGFCTDGFCNGCISDEPIKEYAALAKDLGMVYQSIHAPWGKSADMWHGNKEEIKAAVDEFTLCLNACAKYNVPIMVAHVYIGFYDGKKPNEQGLDSYGRIIELAKKLGVKIAFENTEGDEYLAAIMKHFSGSDAVGFCWDSGHEMCYNYSKDLLALYGDKLIATHINDNLGIKDYNGKITWHDDLHLLPFDGIADWDYNAERMAKCGYGGILTFELNMSSKPNRHENDIYRAMGLEKYLSEAYKRACKIAAKMQKFTN